MLILGINAFHGDSAACLLDGGILVAASEEERYRRVKHWAGFPSQAIQACLRQAGVGLGDIHAVALNQDAKANIWRKASYVLQKRPSLGLVLDRIRNKQERAGVAQVLEQGVGGRFKGEVVAVEHHLAHLASAYLASPFPEAVAASLDGFGDFASAAWGVGRGSTVEVDERVYFPHSLGIFYQALTQFLGFPHYGDEYKLMGLAPYGEPGFLPRMRRIVRLTNGGGFELDLSFFRHATDKVEYEWDGGSPVVGTLYSAALVDLLGPARGPSEDLTQRHRDIARSVQAMYEEAFFHLLAHLHETYKLDALCLAGGCAMNSVANGKVYQRSAFRKLYVQPAAGDAGGAIGAALVALGRLDGQQPVRLRMDHAYWGPQFDDEAIATMLARRRAEMTREGCTVRRFESDPDLLAATAAEVAAGAVVGWFQGRMEWGPRALGNRSIVCDPRRTDMKDILNLKIKRRESFRPFAPSILREAVPEWFEVDDDVPFMTQVYPIRPGKRALIPAVTHVDGSGRLQTVTREANPRFYGLIERFRDLTGVPMVLNTSFNENEPVVCRPEEALDCFLRTKMDVLVMENWFLRRGSPAIP
ncbi:MAG: carbamoyltransferase [Betaproteobacteria bacterium]|nr:MAG: carbamoyltransferase [Betaproteobacteria bacterium]